FFGDTSEASQRSAVEGVDVPLRAAGCFGIGCQDVDARLREIGPVIQILRISRAHRDHHNRSADDAAIGYRSPVVSDQSRVRDLVDIAFERKHGDVCLEAADYRAGLSATALIRVAKLYVLSGLVFPEFLESGDESLAIRLARGGVCAQSESYCVRVVIRRAAAMKRGCEKQQD